MDPDCCILYMMAFAEIGLEDLSPEDVVISYR